MPLMRSANIGLRQTMFTAVTIIIMDREYFDALPEDIQQAVREAAEYAGVTVSEQRCRRKRKQSRELIDKGLPYR